MAAPVESGLVYADLAAFPDDHLRRELISGELFVTPAPRTRHQAVVTRLIVALAGAANHPGGEVFTAPLDVVFTDRDVVQPDVLYIAPDHRDRITERAIAGAPDIVVEVSSPSTRHLELVRKRALYERHGVPEYWYLDLDAERVEVYRLDPSGRYSAPTLLAASAAVTTPLLPALTLPVGDLLGTDLHG